MLPPPNQYSIYVSLFHCLTTAMVPKEHPRVPVPSEPFPDWLRQLAVRLCESGAMPHVPDQVIANEYHLFRTLLPPAKLWLTLCGLLVPQVHARAGTGIPN